LPWLLSISGIMSRFKDEYSLTIVNLFDFSL
jgi:hypothetical protein